MSPCQYNEHVPILAYTKGKRGGYVVDVGAGHPEINSNSSFLISDYDWSAYLIDPLPEHFDALYQRHCHNSRVIVEQCAVARFAGERKLHSGGQGSTMLDAWRERLEKHYGTKYDKPMMVRCYPLTQLLDAVDSPRVIDFLTVDCEGMDMEALRSLDWEKYRVDLVCVEARSTAANLVDFMADRGLKIVGETAGNLLFGRTQ